MSEPPGTWPAVLTAEHVAAIYHLTSQSLARRIRLLLRALLPRTDPHCARCGDPCDPDDLTLAEADAWSIDYLCPNCAQD